MKIALYAGMFRRNQDGASKTLYRLVEGLTKKGHFVAVWAFIHDIDPPKGVLCYTVPSIPLPLYKEYRIARFSGKNSKELKAFKPDVIHISVPDLVGLAMQNWASGRNIPTLATYHTDFPSYLKSYGLSALYNPLWRYFRWFYNRCQRVLAPTEVVRDNLRKNGIRNLSLLQRGIDLTQFSVKHRSEKLRTQWGLKPGQLAILYVGRLVWYKGLAELCQIYKRYHQPTFSMPPRFILVGSGPIEKELKERMPKAIFCGHLNGTDLSRAYASADLFLFPSVTETFGNVILEALASGIPAVVSDQGGCQEIVAQSRGGIIARSGSADDLFLSCEQLIQTPALYGECRRNGIRYTQNLSWNTIIDQLVVHYQVTSEIPNRSVSLPAFAPHHAEPHNSSIT